MKLLSISLLSLLVIFSTSCSSTIGTQVKEPFTGKSYISNSKYFRATGKGVSNNDVIAASKADLEAHKILAQQVQTSINVVTDNYQQDVQGAHVNEAIQLFESLAREITTTTIGDLRKIGSKKFQLDGGSYAVYVVYEIKKTAMFKFLKKKAKLDSKINPLTRTRVINMCDEEIKRLESEN